MKLTTEKQHCLPYTKSWTPHTHHKKIEDILRILCPYINHNCNIEFKIVQEFFHEKETATKTYEDPTPDFWSAGIVLSVSGGHSPQIFWVGTEKNTDFWAIDCQICQISMQVISYRIHGIGIFTDPWMVHFDGINVGKYACQSHGCVMGIGIWMLPKIVVPPNHPF